MPKTNNNKSTKNYALFLMAGSQGKLEVLKASDAFIDYNSETEYAIEDDYKVRIKGSKYSAKLKFLGSRKCVRLKKINVLG
jgi:hypothetical protein